MRRTIRQSIQRRLAQIALVAGAVVIAAATLQGEPAQAIAGVGIMMLGATKCVMGLVERAVRDTSHERDRLQRALREAQAEHTRYMVLRAFVDREAEDLCRQMEKNEADNAAYIAAKTKHLNAQAAAEREELLADIEARRIAIKTEGFQIGYAAGARGITFGSAQPRTGAVVIQLPRTPIGSDSTTAGQGSHLS